jgi:putative ABC transport system substrate-binding protein
VITDNPQDESVFRAAFADLTHQGAQMLNLALSSPIIENRSLIASLANAAHLPTCGPDVSFVDAGALMSYGADRLAVWRRAADYVVDVLNGARPGDLPVEQPQTFQLAVNLKTAADLGVVIPNSVLLQATDVRP